MQPRSNRHIPTATGLCLPLPMPTAAGRSGPKPSGMGRRLSIDVTPRLAAVGGHHTLGRVRDILAISAVPSIVSYRPDHADVRHLAACDRPGHIHRLIESQHAPIWRGKP